MLANFSGMSFSDLNQSYSNLSMMATSSLSPQREQYQKPSEVYFLGERVVRPAIDNTYAVFSWVYAKMADIVSMATSSFQKVQAQTVQVSDASSKGELAERLAGTSGAPEESLRAIFEGAMRELEKIANTTFELPMKERVWEAVSKEKVKTLRETLLHEFCKQILGVFSDVEVGVMLAEHKRTGAIRGDTVLGATLSVQYQRSLELIIDTVVQKAISMIDVWIPEIVEAVRKEGIQLPET